MSTLDVILVEERYKDGFFAEEAVEEMERSPELRATKRRIKELLRNLIDETFDKDDPKALEFWQKVEQL